ncbi:MAG: FAD-dependent oxidoreductase [Pseudomonadota bacterium]
MGARVVLVEKESRVGGLARSIPINGQMHDLGPHRFYTHDPEVLAYIEDILGDNLQHLERKTSIRLYGRAQPWPLTRRIFKDMPVSHVVRVGLELLGRSRKPVDNYEEYVKSRYGATLYGIFFKPFTEKFFRSPGRDLHPDWARASIDRAIIDKKPDTDSLHYLISRLLSPKREMRFAYPVEGGIQAFSDRVAHRLATSGRATVMTGSAVTGLDMEAGRITGLTLSSGERLSPGNVVWTGPLGPLFEMAGGGGSGLGFLNTSFHFLTVKHPPRVHDQWMYVPEQEFRALRVTFPANFHPREREGWATICVEVTAPREGSTERDLEEETVAVTDDLVRLGIISHGDEVVDRQSRVVENSYPVYTKNYPAELRRCLARLSGISNLYLTGRSATFSYNNMDHSIRQAMDLSQWLGDMDRPPSREEKLKKILSSRPRYGRVESGQATP